MRLAYTDPLTHNVVKLRGQSFSELIEQIPNPSQFKYLLETMSPIANAEDIGLAGEDAFGWIMESFDNGEPREPMQCCGGGCCI